MAAAKEMPITSGAIRSARKRVSESQVSPDRTLQVMVTSSTSESYWKCPAGVFTLSVCCIWKCPLETVEFITVGCIKVSELCSLCTHTALVSAQTLMLSPLHRDSPDLQVHQRRGALPGPLSPLLLQHDHHAVWALLFRRLRGQFQQLL